jgi:Protein of unknown function (DUF1161)
MSSIRISKSLLLSLSVFVSLSALALAEKKDSTGVAIVPAPTAKSAAGKTCEALKSEIDGKLKAKGVKVFTLDILAKGDVKTEKVVGSCEAGAKKIVYKKG